MKASLFTALCCLSTTVASAAPVIKSVSPAAFPAAGGTALTITVENVGLPGTVTIAGTDCPVTDWRRTSITCTAPAGHGSYVPLVVTNSFGEASAPSLISYFAPQLVNMKPGSGPTRGGIKIGLLGSNFGPSPKVLIGGNECIIAKKSDSEIVCALPAGEGTNRPVFVEAGGQHNSPKIFNYDPPSIATISPATGPPNGGTELILAGMNFGANPSVTVGSAPCQKTAPPTDSSIRCQLPAGTPGSSQPVVVTAGGQLSAPAPFTYTGWPTITSINPATGPTTGGVAMTIAGSDFGSPPYVLIGLNACAPTTFTSTSIQCMIPPGQGANLNVVVTNASGPRRTWISAIGHAR
jgi:hypothetical protein